MNRKTIAGLVALNVSLLGALAVVSFAPDSAEAQRTARRPGDYVMISAQTPGRVEHTVYIADLNNQAMLAVIYDRSRRELVPRGFRSLSADFEAVRGAGDRGR